MFGNIKCIKLYNTYIKSATIDKLITTQQNFKIFVLIEILAFRNGETILSTYYL